MKLSVLIPMYNAELYIANCIDSILNQGLMPSDYEIIIMDDGSTDNSTNIVNAYVDKYDNILLYKTSHLGAYSTRNKLLKLAKGDYIYNIDADDYLAYNSLNTMINKAQESQCDIIGFDTIETDELDNYQLSESITTISPIVSSGKTFLENYKNMRHEIWWYMIKKEFLKRISLSFSSNEYSGDVVFTLKAFLKAEKVVYIPIPIHRYVQTQNSLMRNKNFESHSKKLEYMQMMIVEKSQLIKDLKTDGDNDITVKNMTHRRDLFTFFNIIDMIKNPYGNGYVREKINMFKKAEAYPIQHFNHAPYDTLMYKFLVCILNKERVLYILIFLKSLFMRPKLHSVKS